MKWSKKSKNSKKSNPIGSLELGVEVKNCRECVNENIQKIRGPIEKAYAILCQTLNNKNINDADVLAAAMEDAVGYLGAALYD